MNYELIVVLYLVGILIGLGSIYVAIELYEYFKNLPTDRQRKRRAERAKIRRMIRDKATGRYINETGREFINSYIKMLEKLTEVYAFFVKHSWSAKHRYHAHLHFIGLSKRLWGIKQ